MKTCITKHRSVIDASDGLKKLQVAPLPNPSSLLWNQTFSWTHSTENMKTTFPRLLCS